MQNSLRLEFVRCTVQASYETVARRTDTVQRLNNLGHIDGPSGEVNTTEAGWLARVNGLVEFAVLDFNLQQTDDGKVAVSLIAVADAVSIGLPPGGKSPEAQPSEEQRRQDERRQLVTDRLEFAQRQMGPEAGSYVRPAAPFGSLAEQAAANAEAVQS